MFHPHAGKTSGNPENIRLLAEIRNYTNCRIALVPKPPKLCLVGFCFDAVSRVLD